MLKITGRETAAKYGACDYCIQEARRKCDRCGYLVCGFCSHPVTPANDLGGVVCFPRCW